jgi:hypothetical protein
MFGPQPLVPPGYDIYIEGFYDLCTERPIGAGGFGAIPITRILEYANVLDVKDILRFKRIIIRLDNEYLKLTAKKD